MTTPSQERALSEAREIAFFGLGFWAGHEGQLDKNTWDDAVKVLSKVDADLDKLAARIAAALHAHGLAERRAGASEMREAAAALFADGIDYGDQNRARAIRRLSLDRALPLPGDDT